MIVTLKPETVNFGTKGQVVIPRRLRKEFDPAGTFLNPHLRGLFGD